MLIKPDGVQRRLIGDIIGRIERKGLTIVALELKNVDDALLAGLPGHARLGDASFDPAAFRNSNVEALNLLKFFHDAS